MKPNKLNSNNATDKVEKIEIDLLIEAIYQRYGYDFRHYQPSTIGNRFNKYRAEKGLKHIVEMIPPVIHDRSYFNELLLNMSVTVTEMFRDPLMFKAIRKEVIPQLMTYPYINVWHAGCATGEEVYSMAILLNENEMMRRTQFYATDINDNSLHVAKKGIYRIQQMKQYTKNYNESGGDNSLSEYYHTYDHSAKMNKELIERITFAQHNLVTDGVFAEMNLIVCKNVLIYFNKELQNTVLRLFADSLCNRGYLCLGNSESINFSDVSELFEVVDEEASIYRKKVKL